MTVINVSRGSGTLYRSDDLNYDRRSISSIIAEKILSKIKSWKMEVNLYSFPCTKYQHSIMIALYRDR